MKHLRETFTDQEWRELKATKESSGLNWHDFLIQKSLYVGVVNSGIIAVKAWCPKCGEQLRVSLSDLEVKTE